MSLYSPYRSASKIKRRAKWREYGFVASLVAWPVAHFAVFWVYVNFTSFLRVFQTYKPRSNTYEWVGLEHIKKVFENMFLDKANGMHTAMLNSLFSAIPGLFIILPLAFIAAYAFYKHVPGERFFRVLFYFPSMISIVALTMSYKYMFDVDFGPIDMLFKKMGFKNLKWLDTGLPDNNMLWPLIYLYCVWAGLGSNVILIGGAMLRIPKDITESARLDGVGFWQESVRIVLPLIMPTVINFIVLSLMGVFGFMMQPMLLTTEGGGTSGQALTVALYIYNETSAQRGDDALTMAMSAGILFSAMFGPLVFAVKVALDKLTPKVEF